MNMLDGLKVKFYGGNSGSKIIDGVIVQTQIINNGVGTPYFQLAIMDQDGCIFIKSSYHVTFDEEDIKKMTKTPDIMVNRIREEVGSKANRFEMLDIRDGKEDM